ncbi:ZIP zinc transporter [Anseongella ginsenosidimutans]|uniref:ZIP zinc transporter n=1 Tax=Anseongella ginsenosidimutans TaxID=496056 RepID=A0A4R3KTG5_9SPHI|nr:ZIP family metal transporter [Anseongella ginsenosidimutans]QEC53183.1 zinc/iron permease [Anseongella ginsenosidimutans]TCS87811.1 ZIP zinc transporter [Anseongella ginsenosidimutans]
MESGRMLVLFFSALLGGSAVFVIRNNNQRKLKLLLSFSGAFLFAITVLQLMPEVYASASHLTGVFILAGFAFQIVLEQFSGGIEHGHMHVHDPTPAFPYAMIISLCLHAFMEAMPLQGHHHDELLWGIALHHIPAAFVLGSILLQHRLKKVNVFFLLVLFAAMSPAGLLFGQALAQNSLGYISLYADYVMAAVVGIFLHISTTILFESSQDHRFNFYKSIAILAGTGFALLGFLID